MHVSSAEPEDNSVTVRLAVHVFDIDQSKKLAEVKTYVFIDDFPFNRTEIWIRVIGGGSFWIPCKNYGLIGVDTWFYQGESNQSEWLLEGMGEVFPFDSYHLRFKIPELSLVEGNFSLSDGERALQASFDGPRAYSLKDLWRVDNGLIPISNRGQNEVSFIIQRSSNSQILAVTQFLLPIIACYYLLGATLILDPEKQLAERLRIYLSLFVFAPTFFMAMQNFLPYRSSLSFPEFFLTNLIISNTIFGIFSIIGNKIGPSISHQSRLSKWDGWAGTLALLVFLVIYVGTLSQKMTIPTSLILTYVVIPSYTFPLIFFTPKEQIIEKKLLYVAYIILLLLPAFILLLLQFLSRM